MSWPGRVERVRVDGGVGPGAVALLAVEVLDEGREGVEVGAGGIPAHKDFAGVGAQVQGEHLLLVVHVDLDLLGRLGVGARRSSYESRLRFRPRCECRAACQ